MNKITILLALKKLSSFHFQHPQILCDATNLTTFLPLLLISIAFVLFDNVLS